MVKLNLDIPESFFEGEERCGYYVSPEMKKVWAVLLDMLNEVARICNKHDIKWFADGGTMLGAVRHGGFIPWDDDIDVRMLRPDYDRFVEMAQKELKHPYFFQTEKTDPGSLRCHAQIRNSETTGILKMELNNSRIFNQGIFLDIFPWDNIHDDENLVIEQIEETKKLQENALYSHYLYFKYWKKFRKNLFAWTKFGIKAWWKRHTPFAEQRWDAEFLKVDEVLSRYQSMNTHKVGNICLFQYKPNWHNLREDYDDVVHMPFEMLHIPVPQGYERVLTDQYGNWKEYKIGNSVHGGVIFDTDRPYDDVIKEIKRKDISYRAGVMLCRNSCLSYNG